MDASHLVERSGPLLAVVDPSNSEAIQRAALDSLARVAGANIGEQLIERWSGLTPRLRSQVISILLARPERARSLLDAIASAKVRPNELTTAQIKFLRSHGDAGLRSKAEKLFATSTPAKRQAVVDQFLPALALDGKTEPGKTIYRERCASCHKAVGEGFALGPDLVTVKTAGKEKLLVNILDPNREVLPTYISYLVETKSGDSYIGILANESATSISIREAFGKETNVRREAIKRIESQKQSLMPEGLEAGMSPQQMADLLAFITEAN